MALAERSPGWQTEGSGADSLWVMLRKVAMEGIEEHLQTSRGAANRPMRLLMLSGRYSSDGSGKWLVQELAEEFRSRGHEVDLLIVDPTGGTPAGALATQDPLLRAYQVPGWERRILSRAGAGKYLPQAARLRLDPRVWRFLSGKYDACIFSTPGVVTAGLPNWLKRSGRSASSVMIMWDFFPVANVEIGAIPDGRANQALYALERAIVRSVDGLVLMTPKGEEFLDKYYTEVPGRRTIVPPWGADLAPSDVAPLKRTEFTLVWGGQITKGRALDDLLHVAAEPDVVDAGIAFVIAGDGPARHHYEGLARELAVSNVEFVGHVPRQEYARILQECHVGASFLIEMSVPTFPSKTVDYCRAGLPVLAAVESGTDFGAIIEKAGAGVAVPSGNRRALAEALIALAAPNRRQQTEAMGAASRRFFEETLDVRVAATRFEDLLTSLR